MTQTTTSTSTRSSRVTSTSGYGSVRYTESYRKQRGRDSDTFLGPNGELVYTRAPQGSKRITVNGHRYYTKDNVFYYRVFYEGKYVYVEGSAPLGYVTRQLPEPWSKRTYQGKDYYYSGGVFYLKEVQGYKVVPNPIQ